MLELIAGKYRVTIENDPTHSVGSTDNVHRYDHEYQLDDTGTEYAVTSRHALRCSDDIESIATCILLAGGGASGIHDHSALIHDGSCIVAVGPFVVSLALPSLRINWALQIDDATCFGVYDSPRLGCLFSHGELLISRVSYDGTIVWQTGGADIFTNGFQLDGNVVRVTDFYDREYVLDAETGRELRCPNCGRYLPIVGAALILGIFVIVQLVFRIFN